MPAITAMFSILPRPLSLFLSCSLSLLLSRSLYMHADICREQHNPLKTDSSPCTEVKESADSPSTLDVQASQFASASILSLVLGDSLTIQTGQKVTPG